MGVAFVLMLFVPVVVIGLLIIGAKWLRPKSFRVGISRRELYFHVENDDGGATTLTSRDGDPP